MINPHDLITKGDDILLKIGGTLDEKIYRKILKFISMNTKNGKVSIKNEDLAIIEDLIYGEIKDSNYEEQLKKYLGLFDALENAISQEQASKNQLRVDAVKDLWNTSGVKDRLMQKTIYDLGQNGIKDVFVKAIADVVRESNYFGLDLASAEAKLRKVLIDDSYTQRYIKQTAMDSLSQFDGALNDEIRVAYDFKIMAYVTNTILTSRYICVHIHDELGGKITDTQLKQVLSQCCPNGEPSKETVKYKVHDGREITSQAGSGMIEGTFFTNFSQLKGGFGCRHRAIWVRK